MAPERTRPTIPIRLLRRDDAREMARVLGEAFADDLPVRRLLRCGREGIAATWRAMAPMCLEDERIECWGAFADDTLRSVAIMMPHDWMPAAAAMWRVGRRMVRHGGWRLMYNGARMMVLSAPKADPREPCWRVFTLGSDDAARGQGYGTALLRHIANEYTTRGVTALQLEVEDVNRAKFLYEREGYHYAWDFQLDNEEFTARVKQL